MKKNKPLKTDVIEHEATEVAYPFADKEELLLQVQQHYTWWTGDLQIRSSRKNGFKDVTDAYYGKLPDDWPFTSRITDPRIRTTLLEKNARLTSRRLKGKASPREGADIVKAKINSALLDFQWDSANDGGSMQTKIASCDMDARLYNTKFVYVYWRNQVEKEEDGSEKILFDGNEMKPLSINDCGLDPNCDHVRGANWFQHRSWESVEKLVENKDLLPGVDELMKRIALDKKKISQNRRDNKYQDRVKQLRGLEDRMGLDSAFPVIEKVVEYRKDQWIVFSPEYKLILGVMDNPYDHKKIPISQLRYYPIDGDNLGESEVESVLPLWRAIQAVLCAYLDEVILKMRPPLKIIEGAARIETLVRLPEAQWIMDNQNAVTEMESRADSIRYFNATYPVLVSAFNVAMGDMSQGVSNADPLQNDKTATEIRQIAKQQNTRDQKNQIELAEFIKDIMSMWIVNNKQFLFKDQEKQEYLLRILGGDAFQEFKKLGMDEMVLYQETATQISQIMQEMAQQGVNISPQQLQTMVDAGKMPRYPVLVNPKEKDAKKLKFKPKMAMDESMTSATLTLVPEDLEGMYDYVPDVKSMDLSNSEQLAMARTTAIQNLTNPNMVSLLQAQGWKPALKDLLVASLEDMGLPDGNKYFEQIQSPVQPPTPGAGAVTGSTLSPEAQQGMGADAKAPTQPSVDQQMAQPAGLQG